MFYDRYVQFCSKKSVKPSRAAEEAGVSKSAVTNWKNTGSRPNTENALKLAAYFGISLSELFGDENEETPVLTTKDERDIARRLEAMLGEMEGDEGALMFDGEPLDDETKELLRASLENQLRMTKMLAKQKFTPKKYRKSKAEEQGG